MFNKILPAINISFLSDPFGAPAPLTMGRMTDYVADIQNSIQNMDNIRRECKETSSGTEYIGRTSVTRTGAACIRWDAIYPE